MATFTLSAVIHREDDLYVAECLEIGTVSQGSTVEEAVANLKEATELFLEVQDEPVRIAPAYLTTFSVDSANAEAPRVSGTRVIAPLECFGFSRLRGRGPSDIPCPNRDHWR